MIQRQQAYRRSDPDERRQALVEACVRTLARLGAHGVSVRTICAEAGVSPGLLRYYFAGIDALIAEAYRMTGDRVAKALDAAVLAVPTDKADDRLLAYLTASFAPPITNPELLSTWLAFWGLTRTDPHIAALHATIYADYRQRLEDLLTPCLPKGNDARLASIGLTALVDGLWLEMSLGDPPFTPDEASAIVKAAVKTACE